jgi:hypothetical protein
MPPGGDALFGGILVLFGRNVLYFPVLCDIVGKDLILI